MVTIRPLGTIRNAVLGVLHSPPDTADCDGAATARPAIKPMLVSASAAAVLQGGALLVSFTTGVLLARLLGGTGYGFYAVSVAWAGVLTIPAILGLDAFLVRGLAVYDVERSWQLMKGLLLRTNQFVLLASLVIAAIGCSVADLWLSPSLRAPFCVAMALIPITALTLLRQAAMQAMGKVVRGQLPEYVIRPILILLSVGALGLFMRKALTSTSALEANVGASAVAFLAGMILLRRTVPAAIRSVRPAYRTRVWLRASLPMMLISGVWIANSYVTTLTVGTLAGARAGGVYSVAQKGAELIVILLMAANMALAPAVARMHARGDRQGLEQASERISQVTLLFSIPVAATLAIFPGLYLRLFGSDFKHGATALTILACGQLYNAITGPCGRVMLMTGHERAAMRGVALGLLANLVLGVALVPDFGVTGGAIAFASSLVLWNTVLVVVARRRLGVNVTAIPLLALARDRSPDGTSPVWRGATPIRFRKRLMFAGRSADDPARPSHKRAFSDMWAKWRQRSARPAQVLLLAAMASSFLSAAATVHVVYTLQLPYVFALSAVLVGAPWVVSGWKCVDDAIRWSALALVGIYLVALVAGHPISIPGSLHTGRTRELVYMADLCVGLAAVGAIAGIWTARDTSIMPRAMVLAGILAAAYALYQWFGLHFGWPLVHVNNTLNTNGVTKNASQGAGLLGWERAQGTFPEPHFLGAYLASLSPLCAGLALTTRGRRAARWLWVAATLLLAGLLTTDSAPAWASLAGICIGILGVVAIVRGRPIPAALTASLVVGALALIPVVGIQGATATTTGRTVGAIASTTEFRTLTWSRALDLWAQRPMLGTGPGQAAVRLTAAGIDQGSFAKPAPGVLLSSQGLWAAALLDAGLLGLASWILLLGATLWKIGRMALLRNDSRLVSLLIAVLVALVGNLTAGDRLELWVWLLLGMALAAASGASRGPAGEPSQQPGYSA